MIEILTAGKRVAVPRQRDRPLDELWLSSSALHEATGWQLQAEGLCRDDVCVPVDPAVRDALVDADCINASGLWRHFGRPVLHDASAATWMLGEAAEDRGHALESLRAPDFTLPDIEGKLHSLSDFRGKKVFLSTWASW